MWSKAWTLIVGIGVVATILSWVESSKWLPNWLAMLAAVPIWSLLSTLAIFALLTWAMWQFGRLSYQADADRKRREQEFQTWLEQKGNAVESRIQALYHGLAQDTQRTKAQIVEMFDGFYKSYNIRLRDVETMGIEGPWIRLELSNGRVCTLTSLAHDFYQSAPPGLKRAIELAMAIDFGQERWSREDIRRACGDYYKADRSDKEYFFDDVASMEPGALLVFLRGEPMLSDWFHQQERLRNADS